MDLWTGVMSCVVVMHVRAGGGGLHAVAAQMYEKDNCDYDAEVHCKNSWKSEPILTCTKAKFKAAYLLRTTIVKTHGSGMNEEATPHENSRWKKRAKKIFDRFFSSDSADIDVNLLKNLKVEEQAEE